MERSLCALLPVRNVESSLEGTVLEMLEILPELTRRFELVVVDDCSCDATIEVADELVGRYPQLLVVRHPVPRGRIEAIATGLEHSIADVVFLADEDFSLSLDQVGRMWRGLEQHAIVLGRPSPVYRGLLKGWQQPVLPEQGGFVLAYRHALDPVIAGLAGLTTLRSHLNRLGYTWHEVEVRPRRCGIGPQRVAARARRLFQPVRADQASLAASRPTRPNYLAKLRDFALGE